MGTRTPGVQAALRDLPDGARVLDAACGIGMDTLALHRRGFRMAGTDASAAMVDQCRARLAAAGVHVPLAPCPWTGLPDHFGVAFDAVLCTGNSLAHAPSTADRRAALAGFAGVLVAGGTVILDTQDWQVLHARGDHRDDDPLVVTRDGLRCTRRFDWRIPERFGDPVTLRLTLVVRDGEEERRSIHEVTFCPFTTEDLVADLEAGGFEAVEVVQTPGDDRYTVTARLA